MVNTSEAGGAAGVGSDLMRARGPCRQNGAILAMQSAPEFAAERAQTNYFRMCIWTFNQIVKAGVAPTDRVPELMIGGNQWLGNEEAREAPFRKELQGQAAAPAEARELFPAGGAGTGDAHKVAVASVWFLDPTLDSFCRTQE